MLDVSRMKIKQHLLGNIQIPDQIYTFAVEFTAMARISHWFLLWVSNTTSLPSSRNATLHRSFRCQIVQRRNVKKRSEGGRSYNCREIEHSVAPRRSINLPRLLKRRTPTLSIVGNDRQIFEYVLSTNAGCPFPFYDLRILRLISRKISFVSDCLVPLWNFIGVHRLREHRCRKNFIFE